MNRNGLGFELSIVFEIFICCAVVAALNDFARTLNGRRAPVVPLRYQSDVRYHFVMLGVGARVGAKGRSIGKWIDKIAR